MMLSRVGLGEWLMLFLLYGLPTLWVWRDGAVRQLPTGWFWTIVTFLTGPIGLLLYLGLSGRRQGRASGR